MPPESPAGLLRALFDAAVAAAQPALSLAAFLPEAPRGRTVVIGAGKAATTMAQALDAAWPAALSGVVVTRHGQRQPCRRIEVLEAAHPVPDAHSVAAAARMLDAVRGLGADDLVICLISGGGSSLLVQPAAGLTLADKQAINRALLASGADIAAMNCVRKHLSAIKGGRLAAACAPARVVTLAISDVPGDEPAVIASGPTVADATSCTDALAILDRYRITLPPAVRAALEAGELETPKPDDACFARCEYHLIATPMRSLEAAAAVARAAGVTPLILGDALEGEAAEVAKVHAGIARSIAQHGRPLAAPCVLLSGGETTVTVRGRGRGGRNVEFLLALAVALDGHPRVHALAADTDGVDGAEDIAGALCDPTTLARARALGIDPKASLADNDGHGFFGALGDALVTGPTDTNVNDFRAILVR
ncbi:glycerate kinase [Plasticicumulans sp.]|uniref:glycerate kinase type-2 family protein n=1 Tax=Plasticicumulans sp. TaxID=2307179 RepID=UPI002C4C4D98|nr:glycerate kinase [Plasticicumulans sp.]HNI22285.1 glycerate kinase [Plasticicumulans sp.]HNJ06811.1 glycerate kinase [Plasticicumulans sp.]HNK31090.1 glycerate kinase [Plasticicumulans sp.]HNM42680.1 glycerate kinase [Plasticicumulans sp.]